MHPSPSVIIFTALSGLGFGLLVFLGLKMPDVTGVLAFIFFVIGYQSSEWPMFFQMLPIYVSLIFLGLSHGAADHLCMWGLLSIKTPRIKLALIGIYFATALLYFLLWLLNPLISILLFFLLFPLYKIHLFR